MSSEHTSHRRQVFLNSFEDPKWQECWPPEYHDVVYEMAAWCHWLFEKLFRIAELSAEELPKQIKLVGHRIDLYLYGDPDEFVSALRNPGQWSEASIEELMSLFRAAQEELRPRLEQRGIRRIEAHHGRTFEPGVVNRKQGESVRTADPALHDRICHLRPGDAGYMLHGEVLFPSHAVAYVHEAEPTKKSVDDNSRRSISPAASIESVAPAADTQVAVPLAPGAEYVEEAPAVRTTPLPVRTIPLDLPRSRPAEVDELTLSANTQRGPRSVKLPRTVSTQTRKMLLYILENGPVLETELQTQFGAESVNKLADLALDCEELYSEGQSYSFRLDEHESEG